MLTAAHNVDYRQHLGDDEQLLVRTIEGGELAARLVLVCNEPSGVDLALLEITDSLFDEHPTPVTFARVNRDSPAPVRDCWAVGFPRFGEAGPVLPEGSRKETWHVSGEIPPGTKLRAGLLALQVTSTPQPLPASLAGSAWEGMSGAVVFATDPYHGEQAVGVVSTHHRPEGQSALTVVPITAAARLSAPVQWWHQLGVPGPDALPVLPSEPGSDPDGRSGAWPAWPVLEGVIPLVADCYQDRAAAGLDLHTSLGPGQTTVLTQVLAGLGGIGKTQLAAKYAKAVWDAGDVDLLVWLTAASRPRILAAYGRAMRRIEGGDPAEEAEAVADRFLAWLNVTTRPWLVVLDDLADPADIRKLWPQGKTGRTVVTTRRSGAILRHDSRTIVEVGVFTPEEALAYLTAKLDRNPDRLEQAAELAEDLGFLPLALGQAAAYISDLGLTCAEYRVMFADQRRTCAELFPDEELPDDYELTVATTWSLSIERANVAGLALPALRLAAMLDPNGIPEVVFSSSANRAYLAARRGLTQSQASPGGTEGDAAADDAVEVSTEDAFRALQELQRFSLLTVDRDSPFRMVRVHALVQRVVRDDLARIPGDFQATARAAADALLEVWPEREAEQALLSQALRDCTDSLRDHSGTALWSPDAHRVIFRCGRSLGNVGLVRQAADYWKDAVAASTDNLGADHPATLEARVNRAAWRGDAGDAEGAVRSLETLLTNCLVLLPLGHPVTQETRFQLARWRGEATDSRGAVQGLEELLAEQLQDPGPDERQTLRTRHELAYWRGYDGDEAGAIRLLADLVPDCQRVLGPDDPEVLSIRADLAFRRGEAGDPAKAAQSFAELVPDSERVNGADHPDTLNYRGNLARWRGDAGDPAGAVQAFTELLADSERVLGPDSQHVLNTRSDLAHYQGMAGDPAGAARELEELVPEYLRLLGPNHWETLANRERLARWRAAAGDTAGAAQAYRELHVDRLRVHGPDHPNTVRTRAALDRTERPDEA